MFKVEVRNYGNKRFKKYEVSSMVEVFELYGNNDASEFNVYENDILIFNYEEITPAWKRYFDKKYIERSVQ